MSMRLRPGDRPDERAVRQAADRSPWGPARVASGPMRSHLGGHDPEAAIRPVQTLFTQEEPAHREAKEPGHLPDLGRGETARAGSAVLQAPLRPEELDHARKQRCDGDVHVGGNMKAAWFKDPDGNILAL